MLTMARPATSYTHTYPVYTHTHTHWINTYPTGDNSVSGLSHTASQNLEPVVPPDGARMTTGIMTAPGSWADLSRSFSVRPHFTLYTFGLDVRKSCLTRSRPLRRLRGDSLRSTHSDHPSPWNQLQCMQPDTRSQGRFLPDWVVGRIGGGLNAFIISWFGLDRPYWNSICRKNPCHDALFVRTSESWKCRSGYISLFSIIIFYYFLLFFLLCDGY